MMAREMEWAESRAVMANFLEHLMMTNSWLQPACHRFATTSPGHTPCVEFSRPSDELAVGARGRKKSKSEEVTPSAGTNYKENCTPVTQLQ